MYDNWSNCLNDGQRGWAPGGSTPVVRLLVERGANVNAARKSDGCTAIMWASEKGHLEIAQLLVESPAAESFATASGSTTSTVAVSSECRPSLMVEKD